MGVSLLMREVPLYYRGLIASQDRGLIASQDRGLIASGRLERSSCPGVISNAELHAESGASNVTSGL